MHNMQKYAKYAKCKVKLQDVVCTCAPYSSIADRRQKRRVYILHFANNKIINMPKIQYAKYSY